MHPYLSCVTYYSHRYHRAGLAIAETWDISSLVFYQGTSDTGCGDTEVGGGSAISSETDSEFPVENAFDSNTETFWRGTGDGKAWIGRDWNLLRSLKCVEFDQSYPHTSTIVWIQAYNTGWQSDTANYVIHSVHDNLIILPILPGRDEFGFPETDDGTDVFYNKWRLRADE